jgi:hypothetical protein
MNAVMRGYIFWMHEVRSRGLPLTLFLIYIPRAAFGPWAVLGKNIRWKWRRLWPSIVLRPFGSRISDCSSRVGYNHYPPSRFYATRARRLPL